MVQALSGPAKLIPKVFFLAVFVAGLCLGVYAMLHGVERNRSKRARETTTRSRPSAFFNVPTAGAFCVALGATGYLFVTRTSFSIAWILILGLATSAVVTAGMIVLMARWALPYSGMPTGDDDIQGQLALVTEPISASTRGEIAFVAGGVRRTLAALGIEESEIPRDSEVVIDTIEDGVARVELWSTVERRL
jgi:hypothetical protein